MQQNYASICGENVYFDTNNSNEAIEVTSKLVCAQQCIVGCSENRIYLNFYYADTYNKALAYIDIQKNVKEKFKFLVGCLFEPQPDNPK